MSGKDFLRETVEAPETPLDVSLRPPLFAEFSGQARVVERLQLMVEAAKARGDALQHILLSGPPGLGKTTLALILGNAMGAEVKCTSGPTIEKAGDLAYRLGCRPGPSPSKHRSAGGRHDPGLGPEFSGPRCEAT